MIRNHLLWVFALTVSSLSVSLAGDYAAYAGSARGLKGHKSPAGPVAPGDCAPLPACKPPCISYHYRGCKKNCCEANCGVSQKIVLEVADPACCGKVVEVPVCIPGCCQGDPCVTRHCGLFGRGVVNYEWDSGFCVRIVFLACGDIRVTYFG